MSGVVPGRPRGPIVLRAALDPKPWGGRALAFQFDLPPDTPIGEAHLTGALATVRDGIFAGRTLGDLMAIDPVAGRSARVSRRPAGVPSFRF
ncbi:MAG: hypothetical protein R2845_05370 [Thermomicrobiales bacterium]